ncbi:HNH endonuclease [Actinomadura alba]|uniref:HNH endonuclease n=1 Tax=Actinomadura alba TaxID=406431 RepID=A0ABR7LHF7_9ACTN|nr:HNH endonuclease [Actinomadura alba]MBC6464270.1 HNH endonuclease [Actinomadura alba]
MAASSGRKGRRWRRIKAQVLADCAGICIVCRHGGATYTDHVVPIEAWKAMGGDPEDPANLRPIHGALNRCSVCHRCCNESKGDRPLEEVQVVQGSRDW